MKKNLLPSIVLGSICLVVAVLLSVVNMFTSPVIADRQNAAANAALLEVLPDGKNFKEIEITSDYPEIVTKGYTADGGCVFQMQVTGKSSGLIIMCGVSSEGKITGTKVIANEETPSYAEKVFPSVEGTNGKYTDMTLDTFEPQLVAGATLTSKAFSEAIKAALQSAILASGGSVDTRTPEEILQDNCNAALGTEGKTFTKWFATEIITGVDTVYETAEGRVYVIGESFIGIKADGTISAPGASTDDIATASAANAIISASVLTEITTLPTGVDKSVEKAYVTSSGNYVFELKASGYKHATNMEFAGMDMGYFYIKLSISAEGKIIDCLTTSHEESKGFGDACATDEYYEQYRGKGDEDIKISVSAPDFHEDLLDSSNTDVGVIASSTFTTYGYQKAVKAAFAAFNLLTAEEGGN